MKNKSLWFAFVVLLFVALVWLTFIWVPAELPSFAQGSSSVQLSVADKPSGGDFTLESPSGPVSLSDYRGKLVLIYFGYTFCPDVCPTSLSILAQALTILTPEELAKVKSLFISVDPERDTMEVLKAYAPFFHANITGITGSPAQVAQVARQYGAHYMKQKPDSNGLYSVDHSSFTYVVAPNGTLVAGLPHASSAQQIVDAVRAAMKARGTD